MSMSGIEVDPEIPILFNDMKLRSTNKWAIFRIEKKTSVVVDQLGDPCVTENKEDDKVQFDQLKTKLTSEPRYILYDFGFTKPDGRIIKKLAFIFWCDDNNAKIGDKMIYASTKDTVKKNFSGLSLEFQANDAGDLDYTALADEVEKKV